jgi:hypothetical protein
MASSYVSSYYQEINIALRPRPVTLAWPSPIFFEQIVRKQNLKSQPSLADGLPGRQEIFIIILSNDRNISV